MPKTMRTYLGATLAVIGLSAMLAGCGVRGALEAPPKAKAQQQSTATAQSGQGKPQGKAPKPHKTFVLDGLIR